MSTTRIITRAIAASFGAASWIATPLAAADWAGGAVTRSVPLDNARFTVDGAPVTQGSFATNVLIDSVSFGQTTFTRETGKLHEVAAVRVWRRDADRGWMLISDEELVAGSRGARIISGRDVHPTPTSGLDTLGGLSVASLLASDGTADIRVDVLFPTGLRDNKASVSDREPEAIVVGPIPTGEFRLGAILGGDIDDPVVADTMAVVSPDALSRSLSAVAIQFGNHAKPLPIAMIGYDMDELGAGDGAALGWRLEIPAGVIMACKLFGCGEGLMDMLASADAGDAACASFTSGGGELAGAFFTNLPTPGYRDPQVGSETPFSGDGGSSQPPPRNVTTTTSNPPDDPPADPPPDPPDPPVDPPVGPPPDPPPPPPPPVPGPAASLLVALALLHRDRRRRSDRLGA